MANNPQFTDSATEAAVNAVAVLLNGGTIQVYTGTQPADANQAITGTLLVTLTFSATAFAAATASGATGSRIATALANSITSGTAGNTGTAVYFALVDSSSAVRAMGSVGTSGADMNLSTTSIVSGGTVALSSGSITQAET